MVQSSLPLVAIDFQASYIRDLNNATDYPEFAVKKQAELLKEWLLHKQENIMGFREKAYRSTVTGTMASRLPARWLDIKDDSLESFMSLDFVENKSFDKVD